MAMYKNQKPEPEKIVTNVLATLLVMIITILFFGYFVIAGIDKTIRNQDEMLCEASKRSGNTGNYCEGGE